MIEAQAGHGTCAYAINSLRKAGCRNEKILSHGELAVGWVGLRALQLSGLLASGQSSAPLAGYGIAPTQPGEAQEIRVSRVENRAVLHGQRGNLSICHEVACRASRFQQFQHLLDVIGPWLKKLDDGLSQPGADMAGRLGRSHRILKHTGICAEAQ